MTSLARSSKPVLVVFFLMVNSVVEIRTQNRPRITQVRPIGPTRDEIFEGNPVFPSSGGSSINSWLYRFPPWSEPHNPPPPALRHNLGDTPRSKRTHDPGPFETLTSVVGGAREGRSLGEEGVIDFTLDDDGNVVSNQNVGFPPRGEDPFEDFRGRIFPDLQGRDNISPPFLILSPPPDPFLFLFDEAQGRRVPEPPSNTLEAPRPKGNVITVPKFPPLPLEKEGVPPPFLFPFPRDIVVSRPRPRPPNSDFVPPPPVTFTQSDAIQRLEGRNLRPPPLRDTPLLSPRGLNPRNTRNTPVISAPLSIQEIVEHHRDAFSDSSSRIRSPSRSPRETGGNFRWWVWPTR